MSKPVHQLPPPDQMPEKKLPVLREMRMIARYGAARVMSNNLKPREEKYGIHQTTAQTYD